MRFTSSFYLSLATLVSFSVGLITISEDQNGYGTANYFDDIRIEPGVTLSFDNKYGILINTFAGEVTNEGRLFVTDSAGNLGMSVTFMQGIYNDGITVLNAVKELAAPSFIFSGLYFVNNGEIYMGGQGSVGIAVMDISPLLVTTPENHGTITFAQTTSSAGVAYFGRAGQSVINDGTVCLSEMNFQQRANVEGTGCYSVGNNSLMLMDSPAIWTLSEGQTVYLSSPSSQIRIGAATPLNTINIAGWGNGNMIGFSGVVTSTRISGSTLTVFQLLVPFYFNIGPGYDNRYVNIGGMYSKNGFIVTSYVSYNMPPPDTSRPAVCNVCRGVYEIPVAPTPEFNFTTDGNSTAPPSSSGVPLSSSTQLSSSFLSSSSVESSSSLESSSLISSSLQSLSSESSSFAS
ncbi:hypothetical protein CLUG_05597 [Clavispora lusitaniae ATCC 42720]|uniref:Hyphally-regulated cell wall protein N-terminal domain-containing protein n=3 Tax=Clavispora lusitaniae TaxID=36911 RepID=C4YBL9_CLAL4|nr:uncharacterized protein CLUG_05597 [Clavispora lusitaniae ATCC 42720]EEQ41469.1 hypothetical protein CLUG_05597 [Clavispora lusitaniae ATCC 42720]